MRKNRMKEALREGRAVVGSVMLLPDPFIAEILGGIGFDFIIIDMEHSAVTQSGLHDVMLALRGTESTIVVRAEWNDFVKVKRILDVGAEGVIFPWVSSAKEARAAVAATRYPPAGIRGWGPWRAARLSGSAADYAREANDNILVLAQIERVQAVRKLDEILSTPGIDGIMIGPADLSWSMGNPPGTAPDKLDEMIGRVLAKCKKHKVPFGMFTGGAETAAKWLGRGGQIATVGFDIGFVRDGAAQAKNDIDKLKADLKR